MTRAVWNTLLEEARKVHAAHPDLRAFCDFPQDLDPMPVARHPVPPADLLAAETGLHSPDYGPLRDAFCAAGPHAHWRETYKDTAIGQDFMDRFGCFALIGPEGGFASAVIRAWVVYMPAHLYYPWHHHPAEEIYLVLAGSARFMRQGSADRILGAGATSFHAGNQPHAMETTDHPVMALVLWRNGFESPPVLTDGIDPAG